ncbi:MAG: aspartyl/glutamyl-tRNA amidotransferase subunit C [Treponema sp.]|jgi:aspartyl-tRNA(Asn)/glutamyl-tRNA(Gln) amidotransferase subunit C|nr:aspartyl/glutamyl-tRNA amidotransferase subunit C [Treponema sp.]
MDIQELETTAQLAHLNLSPDELAAALPAFEQMIGFFAAMRDYDSQTQGSDNKSSPPESALLAGAEHFRTESDAASNADCSLNERILNNAGERDGRFIVIPNVL